MSTALSGCRFLVGDVREVVPTLPDRSFDLIVTSPPFLALRSYLPRGHVDKTKEIGSESTPAEYLDTLLSLAGEWRRVLAPHGSLCVELGDTLAGSGGAGGDYHPGAVREGQPTYAGSASKDRRVRRIGPVPISDRPGTPQAGDVGWPRAKSLVGIPAAFMLSLAYGLNVLNGEESPAGRWRIRTLKPWIKSSPAVGALADKERPATSYVIVACLSRDRYFDLDGVRHPNLRVTETASNINRRRAAAGRDPGNAESDLVGQNLSGAPPLDWYHEVDAVLDAALRRYAEGNTHARTAAGIEQRPNAGKPAASERGGNWASLPIQHTGTRSGLRGWHLRRALEDAGLLATVEAIDINPRGYRGAHYATFPEQLASLLIREMCPSRVCRTCGQPSRRVTSTEQVSTRRTTGRKHGAAGTLTENLSQRTEAAVTTTGWSDCGHGTWRPGRVLDPFVGSGTSLAAAVGLGREATGVDLDARNVELARQRIGLFLQVDGEDLTDE